MPESKKNPDFLDDMGNLTPEEARDIFDRLYSMDQEVWMILAEDFPHPPSALVSLVQKCEAKFPETLKVPSEAELIMFSTGAQHPGRRVMEVAMFIVNNPEAREKFNAIATPIKAERQNNIIEGFARAFRAKIHKTMQ